MKIWATILRSPSASFGSVNQASLKQAKDAAAKAGPNVPASDGSYLLVV
ncbi:MAG: hypothetical protein ABIS29_17810 [Vicinamibacterales bacterium]